MPRKSEGSHLQFAVDHSATVVAHRRIECDLTVTVDVQIAKTNVARVGDMDGLRERNETAHQAIRMHPRDSDILGVFDCKRKALWTFPTLFLRLQGYDLPIGDALQLHLVANMMFTG